MTTYQEFLKQKEKTHIKTGFEVDESQLNKILFDFQKYQVSIGLKVGRFAIFDECGLGKTLMQLEWGFQVEKYTQRPILFLAPLAVVEQTIEQANDFGYNLSKYKGEIPDSGLWITNYDQLKNIDTSLFVGVVLDESSILKGREGAMSSALIQQFANTPYKLACTATPSPNDHMELGQHSEFLGAMSYAEMLAMFFVHDGGETSKWRLRKHAEDDFWKFVCTWSISLDNPERLGFDGSRYVLPEIEYIEHIIPVENNTQTLFADAAVSATDLHQDLKRTFDERISKTAELVNGSDESWIVWGLQNAETDEVTKKINGAVNLQGSDSLERKCLLPLWFGNLNNECKCNTKEGKQNINLNTTTNTIQNIRSKSIKEHPKESGTEKNLILNTMNVEKPTIENITEKTEKNLINEHRNNEQKSIQQEGKNISSTNHIETSLKKNQKIGLQKIQTSDSKENLELNMVSPLKGTTKYCRSKMEDVQYVVENLPCSTTSKDCMLTIAIQQELSEDCYAPTAIKDLGNSLIQKHCSNVPLCTCGKFKKKVLVTKTSIMGFGINAQNCHNMVFVSYDFKFEAFYQAVRRCYRFGQTKPVKVHILIPESQANVRKSILEKQAKHEAMIAEMSKYSADTNYKLTGQKNATVAQTEIKTDDYWLLNGDCVEKSKLIPDNAAGVVAFSPPFKRLYVYSDKKEDMGNVSNDYEFEQHFKFLIPEIKRILQPGRICAVHCMDLPIQKGKEGFIGLQDFSGQLVKMFTDEGFIYHSRVTIWKNPVTEMQRTKALGLLHKQIKKDSVMSRVGIPDYVLFFRNEGDNETPIINQDVDPKKGNYIPVDLWQKYASPVWMDVDYSRTLNYRAARDNNDEAHICPLQLDTIERILHLYSNEGDTVFSPFGGIGSEGVTGLAMNRKSISIELKESYFLQNAANHKNEIMKRSQSMLF